MDARICMVGYGNPQRGDDGVGPLVVERLRARMGARAGVRFFTCRQLGDELLEAVGKASLVILVDASVEDLPGGVRWSKVEPRAALTPFTHHMNPGTLLWLIQAETGSTPETWLVSIEGEQFHLKEGIGARTLELAICAERQIEAFLRDRMRSWRPARGHASKDPNALACVGENA